MIGKRSSHVKSTAIKSVNLSSIFQIGDSNQISSQSRVIAYQKEEESYDGTEPILLPTTPLFDPIPIEPTNVCMTTFNASTAIRVKTVRIKGVSVASTFHIGNTRNASLQTTVKHQRQLLESLHKEE